MTLRPFFTFYGGKYRAAPYYPAPEHGTIIEPFAGSAGYSLRHHDRRVILVERDPVIAATWRYLLNVSPSEILALPNLSPGTSVNDLPGLAQEARWLIGWWCNAGATQPCLRLSSWRLRSGGAEFGAPTGGRVGWGPWVRERIAGQVDHIRHWQLIEGDYTAAPDEPATWFIDPPYVVAGKHYRYGSASIDYARLADFCRSRRGQVIVCENEGADWLPFRPFRAIKASEAKNGGRFSLEAIWP